MLNYRDIVAVGGLVTQGLGSIPWYKLGNGVYLAYGVNRFDTRSVRRLFEFPKCRRLLG